MKTFTPTPKDIRRDWYVVNAEDKILGRLATEIARRLHGKHKPEFTPFIDTGDFIVVVNAEKIILTGIPVSTQLIKEQRSKAELRDLREQVRFCLKETRKIIFDLRPMTLDDLASVANFSKFHFLFFTFQEGVNCFMAGPIKDHLHGFLGNLEMFHFTNNAR